MIHRAIDNARSGLWNRAQWIRWNVAGNRNRYQDEGSLAWSLDNVRLEWADFLERLSGWAE